MEKQSRSRFYSILSRVSRLSPLVLAIIAVATLAGCPEGPPPRWVEPPTAPIEPDERGGAPIAATPDVSSLRPVVEQQRERLRVLIDLAERREINDGGPHLLKAAKTQAQELDQIEAHLNQAARDGASDEEVDEIHEQLRRFSTRLSLLADSLQ